MYAIERIAGEDLLLNYERVKVKLEKAMQGSGRILLRASGTEPLIRVMVQGESLKKVESASNDIVALIESQTKEIS